MWVIIFKYSCDSVVKKKKKNPPANTRDAGPIPGSGRPPEEEVAAHSTILAWKVPEEPGGLQSTGSQRAGYD